MNKHTKAPQNCRVAATRHTNQRKHPSLEILVGGFDTIPRAGLDTERILQLGKPILPISIESRRR